jgi:hypothetical protein
MPRSGRTISHVYWGCGNDSACAYPPPVIPSDAVSDQYYDSSAQQFGELAITIAAVLPNKLDNIGGETLLVVTTAETLRCVERCRSAARPTGEF